MSRRVVMALVLGAFGFGALVGVLGYIWTVGGSGEPSSTVAAPTLSLDSTQPAPTEDTTLQELSAQVSVLGTEVKLLSEVVAADNAAAATKLAELDGDLDTLNQLVQTTPSILVVTPAGSSSSQSAALPTATPIPPTNTSVPPTATPAPVRILYRIVAAESQVSFNIFEELFGQPNPVTGTTSEVAGDVIVDFTTPANSQVGTIVVNARTFVTDNEFRNRAIRSQILQSSQDEYEFIEFTPTALSGLPASVSVGDTVTFQLTGDLKIRNLSNPVTFDAAVTVVSEGRIEGTATAVVTRTAYNLQIPNAPGVANVGEDVTLQINFVATQVQA